MNIHQEIYYERHKEEVKRRAREYYYANKEKVKKQVMLRYYLNHENSKTKSRERWKRNFTDSPQGKENRNKEQRKKYYNNWPENKILARALQAKRRVRVQGISKEESAFKEMCILSKAVDAKCAYCGVLLIYAGSSVDHILPITKGGDNRRENLCLCCRSCNCSKGNKTVEEWRGIV